MNFRVVKYFDNHFDGNMGEYINKDDAEKTAEWFNYGNKSPSVTYEVKEIFISKPPKEAEL